MKILFGILGLVSSIVFFAMTAFVWFYQYNMQVNEAQDRNIYLGLMAVELVFVALFFNYTFRLFKKQITENQKSNKNK